jgi:hypothetical protein
MKTWEELLAELDQKEEQANLGGGCLPGVSSLGSAGWTAALVGHFPRLPRGEIGP